MKERNLRTKCLDGIAIYGSEKQFVFVANEPVINQVEGFKRCGTMHVMSDGTAEFIPSSSERKRSQVIHLTTHGRLTKTQSGAYHLTIKVHPSEQVDVVDTIMLETMEATMSLMRQGGFINEN